MHLKQVWGGTVTHVISSIPQYYSNLTSAACCHLHTPPAVMSFTLYDATIVAATSALTTLDNILTKAETHANAASFLTARLCEDMYPLTAQIHRATRFAELAVAQLSGRPAKQYEEDLASYADMHARIAEVLAALAKADKDTVNRIGEEVATVDVPSMGVAEMKPKAFAMGGCIPNINFHVTTAYAILRKEGVALGKTDYITPFWGEFVTKAK